MASGAGSTPLTKMSGTVCVLRAGGKQGKPEAFARDAMLFERLLAEREPTIAAALRAAGVVPEAYAQKYFCGLCVHVLPFWALSVFLERFLEEGWRYLLKFALALVSMLAPRIQAVTPGLSALSPQGALICGASITSTLPPPGGGSPAEAHETPALRLNTCALI